MDWNRRYVQQAAWTRDLRAYLFAQADLANAGRVLEVGCGTGAVLKDVAPGAEQVLARNAHLRPQTFGLDIDMDALRSCRTNAPQAVLTRADVRSLPFVDRAFDIVFCHFLLLWVRDPLAALREMKRATRGGGDVLALAEPDYGARTDEPPELAEAGRLQARSLVLQGADVSIGARLPELFEQAGIRIRESGMLKPHATPPEHDLEAQTEWLVLEADLKAVISTPEIEEIRRLDARARLLGTRRTYVPTFFAWGQV